MVVACKQLFLVIKMRCDVNADSWEAALNTVAFKGHGHLLEN